MCSAVLKCICNDKFLHCFLCFRRTKYVENCQIQYSYGEEVDTDLVEEEAVQLTQATINEGSDTGVILSDLEALAPEGAVVEVRGKKC